VRAEEKETTMATRRHSALTAVLSAILAGGMLVGTSALPVSAAKNYANCTKLNAVYRHGVGKSSAVDHVSSGGKKVTNFYRSNALYNANSGKDRDHDGIACEKR